MQILLVICFLKPEVITEPQHRYKERTKTENDDDYDEV